MKSGLYLKLFMAFLKIGAFTFGGGWAMIPLIEREVVDKQKWITREDFIDALAIAQSLPGILAVNISILVGNRLRGFKGSLIATLGTILPHHSRHSHLVCTKLRQSRCRAGIQRDTSGGGRLDRLPRVEYGKNRPYQHQKHHYPHCRGFGHLVRRYLANPVCLTGRNRRYYLLQSPHRTHFKKEQQ